MSQQIELATKTQRSMARLIGFITDNPYVNLMVMLTGIVAMKQNPFQGFLTCAIGGGLFFGYIYFGRMGTSISKVIFGLQVVNTETGKPAGLGKMFLRDFVVVSLAWTYAAYFGLLLMAMFQPSTARTRSEESAENAQRAASAALAMGSAHMLLQSGALFKHDNWFKTSVIKKPLKEIKAEFAPNAHKPGNSRPNQDNISRAA